MIMARTLLFVICGKQDVRRVAVAREHRTAAWHTSILKERYSTQQKLCTGGRIVHYALWNCNTKWKAVGYKQLDM